MAPTTSASVAPGESADATAQGIARALALALNDPTLRWAVRDAMRESPFNEHKLVLQEFATTERGQRLVKAAAKAAKLDLRTVEQMIASLPAMDFYAPFPEHRRTWQGTPDVEVGATMDQNDPNFLAYGTDGKTAKYNAWLEVPKSAVLILHPAEPKSERPDAGFSTAASPTIQLPGEKDVANIQVVQLNGSLVTTSKSLSPSQPSYSTTGTGLQLRDFQSAIHDGVGSAEIRWIIENSSNQEQESWRIDGISADPYAAHYVYHNYSSATTGPIVHVREIDTFSSDDFGRATIVVGGITSSPETFFCGAEFSADRCNPNDEITRWAAEFVNY